MTVKCASCDGKIAEGQKFCPTCGVKVPVPGGASAAEIIGGVRTLLTEAGILKAVKVDPVPDPKADDEPDPKVLT